MLVWLHVPCEVSKADNPGGNAMIGHADASESERASLASLLSDLTSTFASGVQSLGQYVLVGLHGVEGLHAMGANPGGGNVQ